MKSGDRIEVVRARSSMVKVGSRGTIVHVLSPKSLTVLVRLDHLGGFTPGLRRTDIRLLHELEALAEVAPGQERIQP